MKTEMTPTHYSIVISSFMLAVLFAMQIVKPELVESAGEAVLGLFKDAEELFESAKAEYGLGQASTDSISPIPRPSSSASLKRTAQAEPEETYEEWIKKFEQQNEQQKQMEKEREHPDFGIVLNSIEDSSLQYECALLTISQMTCKFRKLAVSKLPQTDPSELEEEIDAFHNSFQKDKNLSEICSAIPAFVEGIESGTPPPNIFGEKNYTPDKFRSVIGNLEQQPKDDLLALFRSFQSYCEDPNITVAFSAGF